jgi:potassium efflux system protein
VLLAGVLLLALLAAPVFAQTDDAPERGVTAADVQAARELVEADASLSEAVRKRGLEFYDVALSAFSARDEPRISLGKNPTQAQADTELARERARLNAHRSVLRDTERLAEERTARRNEISRRLGALDQEIESINDDLRAASEREFHPQLRNALRASLLARQEADQSEIRSLRAELELLEAKGALIPWRIDQAKRRVAHAEQVVALLRRETRNLRHLEAQKSLQEVREQCAEAVEASPVALAEIAAETETLAESLWGPDGVIVRSETAARETTFVRKAVTDLDRIVQLTRRKFDAYGHRGSIQRWWPDVPEDFPKPGEISTFLRELEESIPEVQHQIIRYEQQRSSVREVAERVLADVDAEHESTDADLAEMHHVARELLDTRRDLLDLLTQQSGKYSSQLTGLQTIATGFARQEEQVRSFLYERLLWVRSVPKPIIPRPTDLAKASVWLISPTNWKDSLATAGRTAAGYPIATAIILASIGLLIWLRPRLRKRLHVLAERVADPASSSYGTTVKAVLYTVLLAAPLPVALYLAGLLLESAGTTAYVYSAASALLYLASIAAVFEITRQALTPGGLAEGHFGWPSKVIRPVHRGLLWREAVFLPLIFVAILFGRAGLRLDSPDELQVYNNALGRVAFIVALAFLGLSLLSIFRPRIQRTDTGRRPALVWLHRVYFWAFPAVVLATIVPAILAATGYYITAFLLAYQMLRTIWLLILLVFLNGMMLRWRRAIPLAPDEQGATSGAASMAQVEKLSRFAVLVIAAFGLFAIWAEAVPALQILKRVQIWPRVSLMEVVEQDTLAPRDPVVEKAGAPRAEGAPKGEPGTTTGGPPGVPALRGGESAAAESPAESVLTLWHLLEALLAVIVTVVLVKNIPGFLELMLRRRTHLDGGARIALSTLVRYSIMIIGFSAAFGFLGISWSKIQWLAAALTFGLGFGLQEIVANFVSGLILLVERPVRVGDAVTVGNLQGRVSRIQIRATTITLWDRSEMIVPNKEFITTKLVNWTLSDSQRRIDIPLRVAYGSDLQGVKSTLLEVARANPNVLDDPPPTVLLLDFGDDALKFELRVYVDFGQGLDTQDALRMAIDEAFRGQGIELALPKLDIRIPERQRGPERDEGLPNEPPRPDSKS